MLTMNTWRFQQLSTNEFNKNQIDQRHKFEDNEKTQFDADRLMAGLEMEEKEWQVEREPLGD